jgi:hypothetical protein
VTQSLVSFLKSPTDSTNQNIYSYAYWLFTAATVLIFLFANKRHWQFFSTTASSPLVKQAILLHDWSNYSLLPALTWRNEC